jgi:hypothetical protein
MFGPTLLLLPVVGGLFAAGLLLWGPKLVRDRASGRFDARPIQGRSGDVRSGILFKGTVTGIQISSAEGSRASRHLLRYEIEDGDRRITLLAPSGILLRTRDRFQLSLDEDTRKPLSISNLELSVTWDLPDSIKGELSPVAPIATWIGMILAPFVAIASFFILFSHAINPVGIPTNPVKAATYMACKSSPKNCNQLESGVQHAQSSIDQQAFPYLLVPLVLTAVVTLVSIRRSRIPTPPVTVVYESSSWTQPTRRSGRQNSIVRWRPPGWFPE